MSCAGSVSEKQLQAKKCVCIHDTHNHKEKDVRIPLRKEHWPGCAVITRAGMVRLVAFFTVTTQTLLHQAEQITNFTPVRLEDRAVNPMANSFHSFLLTLGKKYVSSSAALTNELFAKMGTRWHVFGRVWVVRN